MSLIRSFRYRSPGVVGAVLWSSYFAGVGAGGSPTVPSGVTVTYDLATPVHYNCVEISGTVIVDRTKSTSIQFDCCEVMAGGSYQCGSEASPFPNTITHTITPMGARSIDPSVSTPASAAPSSNRGVMVMPGGDLMWVAQVPTVSIVKLAATAAAGDTSITLASPVTWKAGWQLELSTTKYPSEGVGRERVTIAADVSSSTTVTLTAPLAYRHHGQLQYLVPPAYEDVANTSLSYTYRAIASGDDFGTVNGNAYTGARVLATIAAGASAVLDNRCTVGLLTYPIKFGAPSDTDWTTNGYGAHLMVMGLSSNCRMQGVERYRVGQAGFLGRYPDHQHSRSYQPYTGGVTSPVSGTFLGDVNSASNYIKQSSTRDSTNRGSTIHGTCGFTLYHNVYSNIDTHCIFFEDGSEQRCVVDGNFISQVNPINTVINSSSTVLKVHDTEGAGSTLNEVGPAGVWLTNPQNSLRNNIVMGAGVGYWNSYAHQCFGLSRDVALNPFLTLPTQHYNNEAGCARYKCMSTLPFVADEAGNLGAPTTQYQWGNADNDPVTLNAAAAKLFEKMNFWKSDFGWYGNEAVQPYYKSWTCAGLSGQNITYQHSSYGIFGNTWGGMFDACSFFAKTLDDYYSSAHPTIMISYGNSLHRANSIFVGAPQTALSVSGAAGNITVENNGGPMTVDDFYVYPIFYGNLGFWGPSAINTPGTVYQTDHNNSFLGANPGLIGMKMPPAFLYTQFGSSYTAIYDPAVTYPGVRGQVGAFRLPDDGCMFGQAGWWTYDSPYMLYGTTGAVAAASISGYSGLNGKLLPIASQNHMNGILVVQASEVSVNSLLGLTSGKDGVTGNPAINYKRIQSDFSTPVTNGTWNTPTPAGTGYPYLNMRHAIVPNGGIVDISWARIDVPLPTSFRIELYGTGPDQEAPLNNHFFLSLDWDHTTTIAHNCRVLTYQGSYVLDVSYHLFASVASKSLLQSSTTCSYWVDSTNDKVWIHAVVGDLNGTNATLFFNSDL